MLVVEFVEEEDSTTVAEVLEVVVHVEGMEFDLVVVTEMGSGKVVGPAREILAEDM